MKKRILSILMIICVMLSFVPISVSAAQSYGIMVGGTEVTTSNYKDITGSGIRGKVSYDPETNTLTLNNAAITSYYDADSSTGDLYGILSNLTELTLEFVGNNTIQPAISGTGAAYCTGIGAAGSITICAQGHCDGDASNSSALTVIASGAGTNTGIMCADTLTMHDGTVRVESGCASSGSSYGIFAANMTSDSFDFPVLSVTAGSSTSGDSIGIYSNGDVHFEGDHAVSVKSSDASFSAGIYARGLSSFCVPLTVTSGTASEYDSVAIFSIGSIDSYSGRPATLPYEICATAGTSLKGSSVAVFSDNGCSFGNLIAKASYAPEGMSIGVCISGAVNGEKMRAYGGEGLHSFGIHALDNVSFQGGDLISKGNTAANGDSIGIYTEGWLLLNDSVAEIYGGSAVNGLSAGVWTAVDIVLYNQYNFKVTLAGNDQAVNVTPVLRDLDCYWAGNTENTNPTREMNFEGDVPLTNAEQYKYLYLINERYVLPTPFDDVPKDEYYVEPVLWAVENSITTGITATTFCPNNVCTRAQTVTFLWRANGCPVPESTKMPFTDVKEGEYYYDAVLWAVENGITTGITETTFCPDATVTRAQVVTFLWRGDGAKNTGSENPFHDVNSTAYYYNAVLWAVEEGITTGMTATTFLPNSDCTRAQIVTFLWRAAGSPALNQSV